MTFTKIAALMRQHLPEHTPTRRTAVLVPLMETTNGLEVLFQVRSFDLNWQPGDICFPGGHYEDGDETMQNTVVRETSEELGLPAECIEVFGKVGAFNSPLGMEVHIFAGRLHAEMEDIRLDPDEVQECFTVPLPWLIEHQPQRAIIKHGTKPGDNFPFDLLCGYSDDWKIRQKYPVLFYNYNNRIIWGLTAEVLVRFLNVIAEKRPKGEK
ncbi:MAG: CoA pyrophosphatase [Negativicutes bacterium]